MFKLKKRKSRKKRYLKNKVWVDFSQMMIAAVKDLNRNDKEVDRKVKRETFNKNRSVISKTTTESDLYSSLYYVDANF